MKKILTLVLGITMGSMGLIEAQQMIPNIQDESLTYDVLFKWGFIEKKAGVVNLATMPDPDSEFFTSVLTGRSVDLADNIYTVRDTLLGKISKITVEPVTYERIAHEGGGFYRDKVSFENDGNGNVTGNATSYKLSRDGKEKHGTKLMTATGITLDMLSALYYTRFIDYDNLKPGEHMLFNIFSGSKQERLRITYIGKTNVTLPDFDDQSMPVYHISFTFTYNDHDKKKSSDPIEAWIGIDEKRIPYQLTGKLPIGGIKCILSSSTTNL